METNLAQTREFFTSHIAQVHNSLFSIENKSENMIQLKKNCQAVTIMMTTGDKQTHQIHTYLTLVPLERMTAQQVINDIDLFTLTKHDRKPFTDIIKAHLDIFQPDLPSYNNADGTVYANFEWARKAKPPQQNYKPQPMEAMELCSSTPSANNSWTKES